MQDYRYNLKNYFDLEEVTDYYFRKRKRSDNPNFYLKVMHVINRIAIIGFLAAVIFLIIRHIK